MIATRSFSMRLRFYVLTTMLALIGFGAAILPASGQSVLINEIFYRPASTNTLEEWFEIYNPSATNVDLSGWTVSKGVSFAFPTNATVAAGGYLVVAADEATFKSIHPQTTNFVAGWRGSLRDDGEQLELQDASGAVVNSVSYAPQGDWAVRQLGAPDQYNKVSWEWFAEHDGLGKSAELRNPALPNDFGHNWASSGPVGGTPGAVNSGKSDNIAPIITAVRHFPVIPKSSDAVTINAKLIDESTIGLSLTLHWRVDGQSSFAAEPMFDDGAHGDGLPNDRLFGFRLAAHLDGTIVEFYLVATDAEGNSRTYPNVIPSGSARTANLLYQVDNEAYNGTAPLYRIIMAKAEYDYLKGIWSSAANSDADVSGSWVTIDGVIHDGSATQVRHSAAFRNRGHGSRTSVPHNFHVNVPKDRLWQERVGINLNTQNTASQMLGSLLMRRAGLPMPESRAVRVRVNSDDLANAGAPQFGSYVANELMNGDYIARQNPDDPNGNLYRGMRDTYATNPGRADLSYHGPDYTSYTNAYFKENNKDRSDWSDLIHLTDVLTNSPDASYVAAVKAVADTDEWMRYFAINTLMGNQETTLGTGSGDDIILYRGLIDPRFDLLPYDMDSILGRGSRAINYADGLFRMTGGGTIPALERFVKHPEFAPVYYRELLDLAQTIFDPARMNPVLDQVAAAFPATPGIADAIGNMKAFNLSQFNHTLGLIPTRLTITNNLALQNGYAHTTSATVSLGGRAHAAKTRQVLVNGAAAAWSAWEAQWGASNVVLHPGLNRVTAQSLDESGCVFETAIVDIWRDDGSVEAAPATISANTTLAASSGPYAIASPLTVANGATLTIEPGTTIYFGAGANLNVANGGRLIAEGTAAAPIRFTRAPGAIATWGGIVINGDVGSPETRIRHAHIEFNGSTAIHSQGGTVYLERLTFGATDRQYVSLDDSSFVVRDCLFPTATAAFELNHGTGGVKPGGHGLFLRNFYGATLGYNDVIDFTGGQRGAGPIVEFINNVFTGSSDDILDLDGTDAWVEGNIFLRTHKNGSPDSSSAISGGNNAGQTSEVTVIGNLFFDVDQAATAKQGNFYTILNNTIVRQTKVGGLDAAAGVFNFADDGTTEGAGMYVEGNIIVDTESLTRNLTAAAVTFTNNILSQPWAGNGGGNLEVAPLLTRVPTIAETQFTTWEEAQVMRDWFSLRAGSPALEAGPNGQNIGGKPVGVTISGEPVGTTAATFATITVGSGWRGQGIPVVGFPNGSGYTHFKWRLDGGAWSAETPIEAPITLTSLAPGDHFVEAVGKRDSGLYQDDPLYGPDAVISASRHWIVDPAHVSPPAATIVINEILAKNVATFTSGETTPDLIELRNVSASAVDLGGMGLSDDAANPYKFTFPANTTLAAGAYLVLLADGDLTTVGTHLNFALSQDGETVLVSRATGHGGGVLDSISFGPQIPDFSIGRRRDGTWGLCRPTFGAENIAAETGEPRQLKISEWLANERFILEDDFVELFNPTTLPIVLEGLYLSDSPGTLNRHRLASLTFVEAGQTIAFTADGDNQGRPSHLNFKLASESGSIHLSDADLTLIDVINYGPQQTDISQGRTPSGADTLAYFSTPTPGGLNPGADSAQTNITYTSRTLVPMSATWKYNAGGADLGSAWHAKAFVDTTWASGQAPFGVDPSTPFPYPLPIKTPLTLNSPSGRIKTYYFRTHFDAGADIQGISLYATNYLDDGAVFYLNGNRVGAIRVTDNPALYTSDAAIQSNEGQLEVITFPTADLVPGDNVLAVEVHQSGNSSTDVIFDMALAAVQTTTNVIVGDTIQVVLNEVLARNQTVTNQGGGVSGWVELHNPATNAVDLANFSLSDTSANPRKWIFAPGTIIPADGYWTVRFDTNHPASSTNTGFNLPWNGGAVYLFASPAHGGGVLDAVAYGLQTPDFAIGRANGDGEWTLTIPTENAANIRAGLGSPGGLRLNEWMADPASGSDWFEVYNPDSAPVALDGLAFTDDLGNTDKSVIQPLSFIGAGRNGFAQFFADNNVNLGANHVAFKLGKGGSPLGIFAPSGFQIDALAFGSQATGVSQGRLPDGAGPFTSFRNSASPNAANFTVAAPIDTDGDGMPDAWEDAHRLNKFANDADDDADADGLTNLEEFLAGYDPQDSGSALVLEALRGPANTVTLRFNALVGHAYTVQFTDDLASAAWFTLREIPAAAADQIIEIPEGAQTQTNRFYRIVLGVVP
jgi:hypothetical protein